MGITMSAKFENENGMITISNDVIANIAGDAATRCYGVVGMAVRSRVDGIASLLKRDAMSKGIKVTADNNELIIDVHVIVGYGINIKSTSESIIESVKYNVEKVTDFTVKEVNVHVESVKVND